MCSTALSARAELGLEHVGWAVKGLLPPVVYGESRDLALLNL